MGGEQLFNLAPIIKTESWEEDEYDITHNMGYETKKVPLGNKASDAANEIMRLLGRQEIKLDTLWPGSDGPKCIEKSHCVAGFIVTSAGMCSSLQNSFNFRPVYFPNCSTKGPQEPDCKIQVAIGNVREGEKARFEIPIERLQLTCETADSASEPGCGYGACTACGCAGFVSQGWDWNCKNCKHHFKVHRTVNAHSR